MERSDIIHIMKMHGITVAILAVENEPQVTVKQNESLILSEIVKSIDDLKIFLEERLYRLLSKAVD